MGLKAETALILVVKLCLLAGLWLAYFRAPLAPDGSATARRVLGDPAFDRSVK